MSSACVSVREATKVTTASFNANVRLGHGCPNKARYYADFGIIYCTVRATNSNTCGLHLSLYKKYQTTSNSVQRHS